jgi:hypothetical protein
VIAIKTGKAITEIAVIVCWISPCISDRRLGFQEYGADSPERYRPNGARLEGYGAS